MFRVFCQLHRGINHDRHAGRRLGHVHVVDLDADERVRKRSHRKRRIDLQDKRYRLILY